MTTNAPTTPSLPPSTPRKPRRLLGLREVVHKIGLAKPTIYRLLAESRETGVLLFPLPVQISKGRIGWHEHEIDEWIASRPRSGAPLVPNTPKPRNGGSAAKLPMT